MFNYSQSETVIPSLVFTKAELVYAVSVLMADIPPTDNATRIEMVELRHYLTLIKDTVAKASQDGTLKRAMAVFSPDIGNDTSKATKAAPMPSMDELRQKFPSLTDDEIQGVLARVEKERNEAIEKKRKDSESELPPIPSFIDKPAIVEKPTIPQPSLTKKLVSDRENSRKFEKMLGSN